MLILCILDYEGVALFNTRRNLEFNICSDPLEIGVMSLYPPFKHEIEVLQDHGSLEHDSFEEF